MKKVLCFVDLALAYVALFLIGKCVGNHIAGRFIEAFGLDLE